ncbi:hypothetical protein [Undibacterium sp. TS12]|uniref:hypothetical protein n=1 Tax=Undibacterium sp. TS12 TaxID=2908202 RepID=UPI001F4C7A4F|nr:hypothetical protein [Undibacterium sp. TS12]MCH8622563.1 hypothetical protein [Undibacterium sp. TS12]
MTVYEKAKPVELLTIADLKKYPVWQYTNSHEKIGETVVRAIKRMPVKSLTGKLVGTKVRFANGADTWALIGNVDASNAQLTQHFLTLSIFKDDKWFTLARYHDIERERFGPEALEIFIGLTVNQIFPITYDISRYCVGDLKALIGVIEKEPKEKLTRAEIIALPVPFL